MNWLKQTQRGLAYLKKKKRPYSKGQTKSKWFFQADVSSKKRTNEFTVSYDEIKQKVITQANDYHRVKAYTP